jgi:hypothetical protein
MPRSTAITDRERAETYESFTQNSSATYAEAEKNKAHKFFVDIISQRPTAYGSTTSASDGYSYFASGEPTPFVPEAYATTANAPPQVIHHHHHSGLPWWTLCFLGRNGGTTNNYYGASQRGERREENSPPANFAAWAGILVIAGIVIAPALAGSFYLLSELGQNLERLYYNEGYIQAGLGMANIALSLSLSAILTNAVLSTAITALTVSAGFANPVSWAFFIMGCVTLFAAACIHWAVQEGIYKTNAFFNKDALNPEDPHRFTVTDEQVKNIIRKDKKGMKGLDGDKMQNVITAIHHDMTADPTTMTRIFRYSPFFRSAETAAQLSAVRTLRNHGTVNYTTEVEMDEEEKTLNFTTKSLF